MILIEPSGSGLSPDHLSAPERDRWSRLLRSQDRDDFVAARALAARAAAALGVPDARFEQRCERCGGPHGRPRIIDSDLAVSWSHTGGWVAAVAASAGPVGIDIEAGAPDTELAMGRSGRSFVRGEALVKAGVFDLDEALRTPLEWPTGEQQAYAGFLVVDLAHGPLIAAVATPLASGCG
ncbi:hypothetical protein GCM10027579_25430 [Calidifontibacter terrae]